MDSVDNVREEGAERLMNHVLQILVAKRIGERVGGQRQAEGL
jgi:hypothetical protein